MTPRDVHGDGLATEALPASVVRRPGWRAVRALRQRAAWLLLIGWIALPLLPAIGLGMSMLLGVGLF